MLIVGDLNPESESFIPSGIFCFHFSAWFFSLGGLHVSFSSSKLRLESASWIIVISERTGTLHWSWQSDLRWRSGSLGRRRLVSQSVLITASSALCFWLVFWGNLQTGSSSFINHSWHQRVEVVNNGLWSSHQSLSETSQSPLYDFEGEFDPDSGEEVVNRWCLSHGVTLPAFLMTCPVCVPGAVCRWMTGWKNVKMWSGSRLIRSIKAGCQGCS